MTLDMIGQLLGETRKEVGGKLPTAKEFPGQLPTPEEVDSKGHLDNKKVLGAMGDGRPPSTKPNPARDLADLYGSYIDKPNDPNARGTVRDPALFKKFEERAGERGRGYTSGDMGMLQQNPQYRGIRMVLPQSGGSYGESAAYNGSRTPGRVLSEGPTGQPDPNDPHGNGIPRVPPNMPPDQGGLREEVYGHLISRGYPVYGGNGDMGGDFPAGFNPVGFGQRELSNYEHDAVSQEDLNRRTREIWDTYGGPRAKEFDGARSLVPRR